MARIRTVKPELFKHEELFDLEKETGLPIRLAFIGLFTVCDRDGRFKWKPRTLKTDVLPHDDLDFSRVLDALSTRGFVRKYMIDGQEYGVVPTFSRHQVINNRESESVLPEPTESSYLSSTSTRESRVLDALSTPLVCAQVEGKGREEERKGKEGNIVERRNAPPDHDPVPEIFAYWQKCMNSPDSKLDKKRIDKIRSALKTGYSPREICEAIKGCSRSPWHMGQNENNRKYNRIDLILRDADHIDNFIVLAGQKVVGTETLEERNARIIADFVAGGIQDDQNVIDMEMGSIPDADE